MDFFKSIISDDQDAAYSESDPDSPREESNPSDGDDGWSFGGFIKSFAVQSESVIETYRRDLEEFGSGLKKETELLRETASRAVSDLPASIEAAHGALDVVLKSTASMILDEGEAETPGKNRSLNSGRYSRFEAQLSLIQSDLNTFCEEPEESGDYGKWKLAFELGDYRDEIGGLVGENGILEGVYRNVVPNSVEEETFWCRYFYRVDKLKQQESMRVNLVKRAISYDDEEELSWDVDDDDEDENLVDWSEKKSGVDERERESITVGEDEKVKCEESVEDGNDERVVVEEKMVSNQQPEIGDDKKTKTPDKERLGSAAEDEDLSWDIEDDDEPVKA